MAGKKDLLTPEGIDRALAALPDWRYRLGGLVTVYKTPTAAGALELIAAVGRLAEQQNHHPDLGWSYNRVLIRYSSHDAGGEVTERDVAAAAGTTEVAAQLAATAQPGKFATLEWVKDTPEAGGS